MKQALDYLKRFNPFDKDLITKDYFWFQTIGTLLICWNWLSVGWGNASGNETPWFILDYPLNLVSEIGGMILWIIVAMHWKNINVLFLKSYILVMCVFGVYHFYS